MKYVVVAMPNQPLGSRWRVVRVEDSQAESMEARDAEVEAFDRPRHAYALMRARNSRESGQKMLFS